MSLQAGVLPDKLLVTANMGSKQDKKPFTYLPGKWQSSFGHHYSWAKEETTQTWKLVLS